MFRKTRSRMAAFLAAGLILLLGVMPNSAWAFVTGDPDGDGMPTLDEAAAGTDPLQADTDMDGLLDGWEIYYTKTDPLKPSTDDVTLDSLRDTDDGGTLIIDGQELSNGTDPNDSADDSKLFDLRITQPLPSKISAGVWNTVAVRFNQPDQIGGILTFSAALGVFSTYMIQFDGSAAFDSPAQTPFIANLYDRATMVARVRGLWPQITREGRIIYCRVMGQVSGSTQVVASNILPFVIDAGANTPAFTWPAASGSSVLAPRVRPIFTWKPNTAFAGYRLFFTGSKQMGKEVAIPALNEVPFPNNRAALKLGWARWAAVSALGDEIYCRLCAIDAAGRWVFSDWTPFTVNGGATALAAGVRVPAYLPDDIPTFTATAGTAAQWQILFSNSEDFSAPGYVYPTASTWATGPISWTPSADVWKSLTSLGPELFWTVRGYIGDTNYYTFPDGYHSYPLGKFLGISELNAASTPNKVGAPLQSFTVNLLSGPTADAYRIMVCGDKRCAGPRAGDPDNDYTLNASWPAAYGQGALPADFPTRIANLYGDPIWVVAKGRTAADAGLPTGGGAFFFSQPYMVKPDTFLRMPTLDVPLNKVKTGVSYDVNWLSTDSPGAIIYYQLQEATDPGFSQNLQSFNVAGQTRSFTHSVPKGTASFYYRVRSINSFGRSAWSNVDSMLVEGEFVWTPKYISGPLTPFRHPSFALYGTTNNFAVDEHNSYNVQYDTGLFTKWGSGWALVSVQHHPGHGFAGDSYYVSRALPVSGTEKARWAPKVKKSGIYEVWSTFYQSTNRPDHVEIFLKSDDASTEFGPFVINQQQVFGAYYTQTWISLGRYRFTAGGSYYVDMRYNRAYNSTANGTHSLCADAVLFQYIGP